VGSAVVALVQPADGPLPQYNMCAVACAIAGPKRGDLLYPWIWVYLCSVACAGSTVHVGL
jgi:hypothetical protein